MTKHTALHKLSPREKRQAEPRWSYRCEVCKNEWHATGYLTTQYCCGEYATEIDALDAEEAEWVTRWPLLSSSVF